MYKWRQVSIVLFLLATAGVGDDIDTLCYGPQWCTRDRHFFGQEPYCFEEILRRHNAVSKVQAVPDAYVPVLKLEIKGIDIDLPYAQLPLTELPEELDLQDNNLLRGMDGASITSINGCRVTNKIVQLNTVNGEYKEAFQDALRFLKVLHPKLWYECTSIMDYLKQKKHVCYCSTGPRIVASTRM